MARKTIRITTTEPAFESAMKAADNSALMAWLELTIEDLEYRLRYAKKEETQLLQGALRALDDIRSIVTI